MSKRFSMLFRKLAVLASLTLAASVVLADEVGIGTLNWKTAQRALCVQDSPSRTASWASPPNFWLCT